MHWYVPNSDTMSVYQLCPGSYRPRLSPTPREEHVAKGATDRPNERWAWFEGFSLSGNDKKLISFALNEVLIPKWEDTHQQNKTCDRVEGRWWLYCGNDLDREESVSKLIKKDYASNLPPSSSPSLWTGQRKLKSISYQSYQKVWIVPLFVCMSLSLTVFLSVHYLCLMPFLLSGRLATILFFPNICSCASSYLKVISTTCDTLR